MAKAAEKIDDTEIKLGADDDMEAGEADVLAALQALGGADEVKWQVSKTHPVDQAGYCTTYSSSELSLDRIRDEFGAGKYRIRGLNDKNRFIGGKNISLVNAKKAEVTLPVVKNDTPSFNDMIALMNASAQRQMDMMIMMQKSQTDMLGAILGGKNNSPGYDPNAAQANMIAMMGVMKDLFKPSETGAVEMLMKGLELGKDLGGGGESGTDWMGLAAKGFEAIKPALEMAAKAPPASNPRPVPRLPAQSVPASQAPAQLESKTETQQPEKSAQGDNMNQLQMLNWIRAQVKTLAYQAGRKSDPELYAAVFLDNLPDGISEDDIYSQFSLPNALDTLAMINPAVNDFREWFEDFRKAVVEMLSPEAQSGIEVEESEAGDVSFDELGAPADMPHEE